MRGVLPTALLAFITYVLFTGSATPYDLFTGAIVAVGVGLLMGKYVVQSDAKALNPVRWFWSIVYFIWYMLVAETKSHIDVIRRIITGNYNPGIVKVPVDVETSYAKTLIANSITNTPGTYVVNMDEKYLYVHWIDVATEDPEKAREEISADFERFAKRILE
ncbi:cation:proton antiporter [Thermococcus sp. M39]|uniref:Na+/H+ antiporter subunit E n=1 Tax=unclassified Thermococcus TaxID=2627626 RepID=UPI00143A237D|nr:MULTISPECIES: Na+/H+ antiporter subunit E [unclassified Thermococcus]NJE07105.1 cation:proton antiporter [Thermococcus sp. M39]NJE13715.1 cation:proton antiporter [Thermococcus sp. LS2]